MPAEQTQAGVPGKGPSCGKRRPAWIKGSFSDMRPGTGKGLSTPSGCCGHAAGAAGEPRLETGPHLPLCLVFSVAGKPIKIYDPIDVGPEGFCTAARDWVSPYHPLVCTGVHQSALSPSPWVMRIPNARLPGHKQRSGHPDSCLTGRGRALRG